MSNPPLPPPPPEAVLLRLVRKAARVTVEQAATAAGISKAWLSSIENGYDNRGKGGIRAVRASDEIIAALADHLGVSPERLETEGERPDASAVLREIHRSRREKEARQQPADDRPAAVRDNWDDPLVQAIWNSSHPEREVKLGLILDYLDDREARARDSRRQRRRA